MQVKFTKMHALGNNYIYINQMQEKLPEEILPTLAVQVSRVDTGIGSDGMILIGFSELADFKMRVFNSDGSEAKNCGNGLRCVAKYVYELGFTQKKEFLIETLGGIVKAQIHEEGHGVSSITIDMGRPRLNSKEIPMLGDERQMVVEQPYQWGDREYRFTAISMGNPHAVIFVGNIETIEVEKFGKTMEWDPIFPERVNVEFIQVRNPREIIFRVWERGSGITQACGTGACAAVVAGVLTGRLERNLPVTVHLLGGDLQVMWAADEKVYMTGPAEFIAEGVYNYRG